MQLVSLNVESFYYDFKFKCICLRISMLKLHDIKMLFFSLIFGYYSNHPISIG